MFIILTLSISFYFIRGYLSLALFSLSLIIHTQREEILNFMWHYNLRLSFVCFNVWNYMGEKQTIE